ncbi:MAG: TolC family protein [Proteobacteria bacterium]|nr:TolC family protein [Pseudomonadota bacterium]
MALNKHPEIGMAEAKVREAEATIVEARSVYLPHVSMEAGSTFLRDEMLYTGSAENSMSAQGNMQVHNLGLYVEQPLFIGPKGWAGIKQSKSELKKQRFERDATRQDVALNVINKYFLLLMQLKRLEVLNTSLSLSEDQLRLARERYRIGTGNRVDVSRALVSTGEDRIRIEQQLQIVGALRIQLNLAMGMPPETSIDIREPGNTVDSQWQESAKTPHNNPSVAAAKAYVDSARYGVDRATGEYWPMISYSAYYIRQSTDFSDVYAEFEKHHGLGSVFTVSIPLFAGLASVSRVRKAKSRLALAMRYTHKTKQEVDAGLSQARSDLRSLQSISAFEEDNVTAAEELLWMAREQYALGMGTSLELRDAQLATTRARLAAVQTHFEFQIAVAAYHHVLGNLIETYLRSN